MTQVSKRQLNKEVEERLYELLWKGIANCKNTKEAANFLTDLLSPTERLMLAKRLGIAIMLEKGFTYEAIDKALKVSPTTITKVNYWMNYGNQGYRQIVRKILREQKLEEIMDMIEELLIKATLPAAVGSARHRLKQEAGKRLYRRKRRRSAV